MNQLLSLLTDTWNFFKSHYAALYKLLFPIIIPLSILSAVVNFFTKGSEIYGLFTLFEFLFHPLIQGVVIVFITLVITGENIQLKGCYKFALKRWAPLILLYILMSLAVAAGLILFIIPGLIIGIRLMFSEFYCVLYEQNPKEAFNSSWEQTKGHQCLLLGGILSIVVVGGIAMSFLERGMIFFNIGYPLISFISNIMSYTLGFIVTIFTYRVFTLHIETINSQAQTDLPESEV